MAIEQCRAIWGEDDVSVALPRIETVANATIIPQRALPQDDPAWGVYDRESRLVDEAALFRGPGRSLVGQSQACAHSGRTERLEGKFLYGGSFHSHYGHFLLEFLCRYWSVYLENCGSTKILVHSIPNCTDFFSIPFVEKTLGALGLDRDRFVAITEPTSVETLVVPAASFVSQKKAHPIFSDLCDQIGKTLCPDALDDVTEQPVFLSKERLTHGVWNIRNEDRFVDVLRRAGIAVVHPERLALEDQIRLLRRHRTIGGLMGSALHTVLFCPTPKNVAAISHNGFVHSDHVLVDKIKNNESRFYFLPDGMITHEATPDFAGGFSFEDPEAAGADFARVLLERAAS